MNVNDLLSAIDSEIATLQQARALLIGQNGNRIKAEPTPARKGARRGTMSAEARARIAAAQKARWAKQKRAAAKKAD